MCRCWESVWPQGCSTRVAAMAPPAQRGFSPNSTRVSETLWNSLTYFAATLGVAVSMQNQARSANKLALLGVRDGFVARNSFHRTYCERIRIREARPPRMLKSQRAITRC